MIDKVVPSPSSLSSSVDTLSVSNQSPPNAVKQAIMDHRAGWLDAEGIIFDAVGTLIRPAPSVAEAYSAAALRQGVVISHEETRSRFQVHFASDAIHAERGLLSTDEATEKRRWRGIVAGVLPEIPDPDRAFEELWDHFGHPESWRAFPDVEQALRGLESMGVRVCIGSNFDTRLRGVVRGLPELEGWSEELVISSEVGYKKPHRSFFEAACAHLGMSADRVACVGDDLENDVDGAIRAGLSGVLLDRSGRGESDFPWVSSLAALVQARFHRG